MQFLSEKKPNSNIQGLYLHPETGDLEKSSI